MPIKEVFKSITPCFVFLLMPLWLRPKDSKMSETDTLARQQGGSKAGHTLRGVRGGGHGERGLHYLAEVGRVGEQRGGDLGEDARLHEVGSK